MTQWNAPQDSGMMTPPVEGEYMDERPSKWPQVIGVIGIILSSMSLLCGCVGFFMVPLQRMGVKVQRDAGQSTPVAEAQLAVAEQFQIISISLMAIGVILSVFLLAGSIALVRRRRKARKILIGWAIGSLLLFALNVALQIMMYQATVAELNRAGAGDQIVQVWIGLIIGAFFMIVFGIALQVFTLIWFSRAKIKAEVELWP